MCGDVSLFTVPCVKACKLTCMGRANSRSLRTSPAGNITILSRENADASSVSVTYQPYPRQYGIRTTSTAGIDTSIHCSSCDRGAPTEYCYHDDGVRVTLSDTSVYGIHFQDGSLEADARPLADGCTPRYLQRLQSIQTTELVVVCRESCFQLVSRSGSTLTLHDLTCGEGRGGIVVEVFTFYGPSLFQVELDVDGNHVMSTDHSSAGHSMDITPTDCTEPLSLHPIFTQDKFFLRCRTNNGDKVYVLHPYKSGDESLFLDGVPLSSPDGRTFAIPSNTTLKVYNTDNLAQSPGAKDFGVAITFCMYLNSDFLIVLLEGRNQVLVRVFTFLNSAGGDGLMVLPHTSISSPIHKLIAPDVYATSNRTGSVYGMQLFNISNGQPLEPIPNLIKEPLDVFFFRGTGLPPSVLQPLSPLTTPSPSSTSLPTPSTDELSSRLPSETAMAKPPVESTQPKPDESTEDKPTSPNNTSAVPFHEHHIAVGVVVAAVTLAIAVVIFIFVVCVLCKFRRRGKHHGPCEEKGQSGIKIPIPVQPSPSSSGTTTPSTNNTSYQDIPGQLVPGTFSPH